MLSDQKLQERPEIPADLPSPVSSTRRLLLETATVFILGIFLTGYFTYPFLFQMNTHLVELGDSKFSTYVHSWVAHALLTQPRQLWNMNMFYPAKSTLACSENWFGDQLLFLPAFVVTRNPILAHNLVIVGSFVLSLITMYLLMRILTGHLLAAALAGFIYAFAFPRLAILDHMQLLNLEWTPAVVLFLFLFLKSKRTHALAGLVIFLVLQILCSLYLGYLSILTAACYFVGILIAWPKAITKQAIYKLALAGVVSGVLLLPVVLPYLRMEKAGTIDPAELFEMSIEASANPLSSYLEVAGFPNSIYTNLLKRFNSHQYGWEKRLFMGFIPMGLSLLGVFRLKSLAESDNEEQTIERALILGSVLLIVSSYVLSLGPYLHIHDRVTHIGLPFLVLRNVIPGMGAFRVPARFGLAMIAGVAVLAGTGFRVIADCCKRLPRADIRVKMLVFIALLIGISMEFNVAPYHFARVMDPAHVAPEYKWLAVQPAGSVTLELPTKEYLDPYEQAEYVFASVYHWQPLVNGYTSHPPAGYQERFVQAANMPSAESIRAFQKLGVRYAVVHRDKLSPQQEDLWNKSWAGLSLVRAFGTTAIYRFEQVNSTAQRGNGSSLPHTPGSKVSVR